MRCPGLAELPPPPPCRAGWPWSQGTQQLPPSLPDGSAWPRVTVVTPSYNQCTFIEEAIRSVLLQGYPNLEYIIIDGVSTDGTLDVLRKYADHFAYWVSEPDRGQCHAINKGWERATGEIVAYLASDDLYLSGAISASVAHLQQHPDADIVYGYAQHIDERGSIFNLLRPPRFDLRRLLASCFIVQPAVFLRRSLLERIGYLDESLYCGMDYDYWLRASRVTTPSLLPRFTAAARYHQDAKGVAAFNEFFRADLRMFDRMFHEDERTGSLARTAYLPRLLYIAGLFSGFAPGEREDALARLRAMEPPPTVREMADLIAWHDSMHGSHYRPHEETTDESARAQFDVYGILAGLTSAGVVDAPATRRVAKLARAAETLSRARHGALDRATPRVGFELARLASRDPRLLSRRLWWAGLVRSMLPNRVIRAARRAQLIAGRRTSLVGAHLPAECETLDRA